MASRHGLEWQETLWGIEPRWTSEPDIAAVEVVARQHLKLTDDTRCSATFLAQGGFNKLYTIDTDAGKYVMRVALPVDPRRKIASEIATMQFVRDTTAAPIPKILAYDSTNDNPIGFEWILMEHMPGKPLRDDWRRLRICRKEALVKQIALYQSRLYEHQFDKIGNLYPQDDAAGPHEVGSIVSMFFFWGDRGARNDVPRGPFRNSYEWLSARLYLILEAQDQIVRTSDDEEDIEDAEGVTSNVQELLKALPQVFPPEEAEHTTIFHDDIHHSNIIVDSEGNMTAILDWECVSALPLWKACSLLHLLEGRERTEKPSREIYATYDPEVDDGDEAEYQGMGTIYWEHLLEYEQTQLRPLFLAEMERLKPEWAQQYQQGRLKRDMELAVQHCDGELSMISVRDWLKAYRSGEQGNLLEMITA